MRHLLSCGDVSGICFFKLRFSLGLFCSSAFIIVLAIFFLRRIVPCLIARFTVASVGTKFYFFSKFYFIFFFQSLLFFLEFSFFFYTVLSRPLNKRLLIFSHPPKVPLALALRSTLFSGINSKISLHNCLLMLTFANLSPHEVNSAGQFAADLFTNSRMLSDTCTSSS